MAKTLDKTRPYGSVHQTAAQPTDTHDGRAFEQDHTFFDKDGNEWVPPKSATDLEAEKQAAFDDAVNKRVVEILAAKEAEAKNAAAVEAAAQDAAAKGKGGK